MNRIIIYIVFSFLLVSCSEKIKEEYAIDKCMAIEKIVLPESEVLNMKTYFITASYGQLLYGYNMKEHALDVFNLQTMTSRQIGMEYEGPDAVVGDISALLVSSPDSIWVCDEAMHILLLNAEGGVRQTLNVTDFLNEGESALIDRNHATSTAQINYDEQADKIMFGVRVRDGARKGFLVRAVSLSSGDYSDYELDNSVSVPNVADGLYANMSKPNIVFANGKVLYNYPVESHVYVLDFRTGERQTVEAVSHYSKNVADKCRDMTDYAEWERHGIINPHFFEVMYVPDSHAYVRLHLSEHEFSDEPDLTKVNDDRDMYLTLFDEDFNMIGESKLPSHRYSYYTGWCALADGICLFVNNSLDEAEKSEELVLDYYKISL
mgnify:CR=1 FL=1